jgi:hypothetical protein
MDVRQAWDSETMRFLSPHDLTDTVPAALSSFVAAAATEPDPALPPEANSACSWARMVADGDARTATGVGPAS